MLARLALVALAIVAIVNIPITRSGAALARSIPTSAPLVIRNGLLIKEATNPALWVYRDGSFHWITTLDAFERLHYHWQDVHEVEPGFLSQFDPGRPVVLLMKCSASPHIYVVGDGQKHWIADIATFEQQGFVWQDVQSVGCGELRVLPDGDSTHLARAYLLYHCPDAAIG